MTEIDMTGVVVSPALSVVGYTLDDDRVDDELGVEQHYATLDDVGNRLFESTADIVRTTLNLLNARLAVLVERRNFIRAEIAALRDEIDRTERMLRAATAPRQTRPRRAQ